MRVHFPATSFMGYLSRRSPCACSRAAAPLAQWAPRLNGLSKPGSWPIHTPFCTSAMIVQPTEQCVQTVFLMSTLPPAAADAPASFRKLRRSVTASFFACFMSFASSLVSLMDDVVHVSIPNSEYVRPSDHGECALLDGEESTADRSQRRIEDGGLCLL